MRNSKQNENPIVSKEKIPAPLEDLIKVYERYQEAYAKTQSYLEIISPQSLQTNSSQSFVISG